MDATSESLLIRWRSGDDAAAGELLDRYARRLIELARSHLPRKLNARIDPEDVVQSVCRCFFGGVLAGRYSFQRSGDLWRLLVVITLNKVKHQVRRHRRLRRSVTRERSLNDDFFGAGLATMLLSPAPSPHEAVELVDEVQRVMVSLSSTERSVLELRLQEYRLDEIAKLVNCSERTVRRRLQEIKNRLLKRRQEYEEDR